MEGSDEGRRFPGNVPILAQHVPTRHPHPHPPPPQGKRKFAPVMLRRLAKLGISKTDPEELTPEVGHVYQHACVWVKGTGCCGIWVSWASARRTARSSRLRWGDEASTFVQWGMRI